MLLCCTYTGHTMSSENREYCVQVHHLYSSIDYLLLLQRCHETSRNMCKRRRRQKGMGYKVCTSPGCQGTQGFANKRHHGVSATASSASFLLRDTTRVPRVLEVLHCRGKLQVLGTPALRRYTRSVVVGLQFPVRGGSVPQQTRGQARPSTNNDVR